MRTPLGRGITGKTIVWIKLTEPSAPMWAIIELQARGGCGYALAKIGLESGS
jgi:hypothetical protein